MDLSRRRFLGASSTVAITAGGLLAVTAEPAAAAPAFSVVDAAVVTRLARLMSVFPMPFPGFGERDADRIAGADLDGLAAGFSSARRQRASTAIRRLAPYRNATDERLLTALAGVEVAEIVPAVAMAAHLVSDRSDPARDDGATVWLAAVRRHADGGVER
jgi:hypothetical protein